MDSERLVMHAEAALGAATPTQGLLHLQTPAQAGNGPAVQPQALATAMPPKVTQAMLPQPINMRRVGHLVLPHALLVPPLALHVVTRASRLSIMLLQALSKHPPLSTSSKKSRVQLHPTQPSRHARSTRKALGADLAPTGTTTGMPR